MANKDTTRQKILKGAKACLLQHGYSGFTVRAVAAKAGVNHGLVHHYFGSKQALVKEMMLTESNRELDHLFSQGPIDKDKDQDSLIANVAKTLTNPQGFGALLLEFLEMARHQPKIKAIAQELHLNRRALLGSLLGIEEPEKQAVLQALVLGLMLQARIEEPKDLKPRIQEALRLLLGQG